MVCVCVCGGGRPCDVVANVLNYNIVVSEFELKLCFYVHYRTNTLGKGTNPLILQDTGLIVALLSG